MMERNKRTGNCRWRVEKRERERERVSERVKEGERDENGRAERKGETQTCDLTDLG